MLGKRMTTSGRQQKLARYPANGSFAEVNAPLKVEIGGQPSALNRSLRGSIAKPVAQQESQRRCCPARDQCEPRNNRKYWKI